MHFHIGFKFDQCNHDDRVSLFDEISIHFILQRI